MVTAPPEIWPALSAEASHGLLLLSYQSSLISNSGKMVLWDTSWLSSEPTGLNKVLNPGPNTVSRFTGLCGSRQNKPGVWTQYYHQGRANLAVQKAGLEQTRKTKKAAQLEMTKDLKERGHGLLCLFLLWLYTSSSYLTVIPTLIPCLCEGKTGAHICVLNLGLGIQHTCPANTGAPGNTKKEQVTSSASRGLTDFLKRQYQNIWNSIALKKVWFCEKKKITVR